MHSLQYSSVLYITVQGIFCTNVFTIHMCTVYIDSTLHLVLYTRELHCYSGCTVSVQYLVVYRVNMCTVTVQYTAQNKHLYSSYRLYSAQCCTLKYVCSRYTRVETCGRHISILLPSSSRVELENSNNNQIFISFHLK